MKNICPKVFFATVVLLGFFGSCNTHDKENIAENIPKTFTELCASCHGNDLKGDLAGSLVDGSWQFGSRPQDITRAIKYGYPHFGMPSWGLVLSDGEIDTLVSYLLEQETLLSGSKPPLPSTLESQDYKLDVTILAEGLETPWSIDFINPDQALITERPGRLRLCENGVLLADTITGLPKVLEIGQGGLFDVAVDPDYESNGWIYLAFSHGITKVDTSESRAPSMTKIVRGRLDGFRWTDEQVVFEAPHGQYINTRVHFGGRMVFDPEGFLYFSIGECGSANDAQDVSKPNGKIHRVYPDGRVPASNPFYHQKNAVKSIYSYGHRNPQGLAVHPETGMIWSIEHGPMGGDEVNLIQPGVNYGWPVICYGINYNGEPVSDVYFREDMEPPIHYWKPSPAVCGLDFYRGDLFPKWENRLLVGSLKFEEFQILNVFKERVMYTETILKNAGRVRDVACGPDGAIYVVLNAPGSILRLTPVLEK